MDELDFNYKLYYDGFEVADKKKKKPFLVFDRDIFKYESKKNNDESAASTDDRRENEDKEQKRKTAPHKNAAK